MVKRPSFGEFSSRPHSNRGKAMTSFSRVSTHKCSATASLPLIRTHRTRGFRVGPRRLGGVLQVDFHGQVPVLVEEHARIRHLALGCVPVEEEPREVGRSRRLFRRAEVAEDAGHDAFGRVTGGNPIPPFLYKSASLSLSISRKLYVVSRYTWSLLALNSSI